VTSLINKATEDVLGAHSFQALSATVGVVAILLLILLLVEREVLRAFGGVRAAARVRTLTAASLPLLVAAIAIIGTRLGDLVR
jgi:hypothetical protein